MGDWIAVEAYEMRGFAGLRVVVRDSWVNEPKEVLLPDYQAIERNTTLDAVAEFASRLRGLPINNDRWTP